MAEVLITLAIVGIVAAMTIPTLVANYQKKMTVNQLRKVYADLNNVVKLSELENGPMEQWNYPTDAAYLYEQIAPFIEQYYLPYFKSAKLVKEIKNYVMLPSADDNDKNISFMNNFLILSNGVVLSFFSNVKPGYVWLFADINGIKGPNIVGRDIFVFDVFKQGESRYRVKFWAAYKDRDFLIDDSQYGCNNDSTHPYKKFNCGRLIELDGWQISDDYPW